MFAAAFGLAAQAQQQSTFGGFGQQQQGGSLFSSFSNSILNIFSFNIKIFVQLFNLKKKIINKIKMHLGHHQGKHFNYT